MSDEAPKSRIGRKLLRVGLGVAVVAVVALNVFVVPRVFGGEQPDPAAQAAEAAVAALPGLATELAAAPAARYTGTFLAAGQNTSYEIDARVSADGTLLGTIRTAGAIGEILEIGDRAFIRAAEGFWAEDGITDDRRAAFANRWVLVPPSFLGLDLTETFGPAALTAALTGPAAGPRTGDVQEVTAGDRTFGLSTATPATLVSVTGAGYHLAPAALDEAGRTAFFTQLRKTASELAWAADLGSRITPKTRTVLQACDFDTCTAKIGFVNRIAPAARYVTAGAKAEGSVTITVTRKGKAVKSCQVPLALAPGESKVVGCTAKNRARAGGVWRASHAGADRVLTAAQVEEITAALETELAKY